MLKNFLLAGITIGALAAATVPAHADNIVPNQWYTGHFGASNTPLLGDALGLSTNGPILPWALFGDAIAAPVPGWTITTANGGTLTVTDVEASGDQFQMFDNGNPMAPAPSPFGPAPQNPGQASPGGGLTSAPVANASSVEGDINAALGDANFSSATFELLPGVNVITGMFLGTVEFGDFDFIAEVPEPAILSVLGFGLAGLGLVRRRPRS